MTYLVSTDESLSQVILLICICQVGAISLPFAVQWPDFFWEDVPLKLISIYAVQDHTITTTSSTVAFSYPVTRR
jgi:hypothetical protein